MSDYSVDPGATIDRLIFERDAALRREAALIVDVELWKSRCGAKCWEVSELQQRLTAADERVDVLEGVLREIRQSCELSKLRDAQIDAALKPAEGGGDA